MNWNPDDLNKVLAPAGKWSIALLLVGTACYLSSIGKDVPTWLVGILMAIMGYYFSSQVQSKQ